jgi:hypothetical protein
MGHSSSRAALTCGRKEAGRQTFIGHATVTATFWGFLILDSRSADNTPELGIPVGAGDMERVKVEITVERAKGIEPSWPAWKFGRERMLADQGFCNCWSALSVDRE